MSDEHAHDREDYEGELLNAEDLGADPIAAIGSWLAEAVDIGEPQPNAMSLATVDAAGVPSVRTVLLKGIDHGLVFYTNYNSAKGRDLAGSGQAAVSLTWLGMHRQVRAVGAVSKATAAEADAYFSQRPRGAQIAASISNQSAIVANRSALEAAFAAFDQAHRDEVARPPHWGGYRLVPNRIEFWHGRRSRLHDRLEFIRFGGRWHVHRLAP